MRNPLAHIKTIVLFSAIAFAGHVLATPEPWFSGTANGDVLEASAAGWDTNVVGEVSVAESVLSIDLPTNTVVKLTPGDHTDKDNKKTCVVVDAAVFTPTAYDDIDSTVVAGAQTALTVAYENGTTNYYAYITNNWVKLGGLQPSDAEVNVTIELDYSKSAETNVSFKVGGTSLYQYGDSTKTSFPISGEHRYLGRIELAGYGQIHSITTTVEAAVNVTIEPTSVTYGADFTNVTIVATVSGDGYDQATYSLNWNGKTVQANVTPGEGTITITAPIDALPAGAANTRASATYTISVVNGEGSSGEQTTLVADSRKEWVVEDSTHPESTGYWEPDVVYAGTVATVEDNTTYTANSCSTGDLVTITFENLRYAEFSDLSVATPGGTQGAFALAETNINNQVSTNFCVLAKEGENYIWVAADCSIAATTNVDYTVVMTFDYAIKKYSVKVNGNPLTVSGESQFNLCDTKSSVTDFVFKGSGTMSGIKGVDSTCFMAKDGLGHWYTTIAAALATDGKEFIILRDTGVEAPSGWEYVKEGDITKLIKKLAKGLFFMAY